MKRSHSILAIFGLSAASVVACGDEERDRDDDDRVGCELDVDCPSGESCVGSTGDSVSACEPGLLRPCACRRLGDVGIGGTGGGGAAGAGASGGAAGAGASGGVAGTGPAACTADRECREPNVCIDLDGNRNDICESGESCACGSLGGVGGSAGSGGSAGLGGSAGSGAASGGGTGGSPTTGDLGLPCTSDSDCGDLLCLTAQAFNGEGPPGGTCTATCAADGDCGALQAGARCVVMALDEGGNEVSFCMQACTPGPGATKCHGRPDFVCDLVGVTPTASSCTSSAGCAQDQICLDGVCQTMVLACAPRCGSDADCEAEQFCDLGSGLCTLTDSTKLPIGALCDPALPVDEDPCEGFCVPTDTNETEGTCAALCSLNESLTGCGWDGTGPADAACLYSTVVARDELGQPDPGLGDLMMCAALCDCNADCPAAIEYCVDETDEGFVQQLFGRAGYCRPLIAPETTADTFSACPGGD